jgi:hypothetical protein
MHAFLIFAKHLIKVTHVGIMYKLQMYNVNGQEFSHHLELLNVLSSMMLGRSFMNILKRLGLKTRPV